MRLTKPASVPLIGIACHQLQHARAGGANQQWNAVTARPYGRDHIILNLIMRAPKIDALAMQERLDDLQRFFQSIHASLEVVTEGVKLRLMSAGAHTQDQPAAADLVQGVRHFGEQCRVAEGCAEHERPQLDALCRLGQR